ncbi:MAG: hypothetical protein HZA49_09465 [Planctomycetes bacterium]|nr:hypothetical protein [Planctomycetota bacterium]
MINKIILGTALAALILMVSALAAPADAITVTYPAGSESLKVGASEPITWTSEGAIATVNIEYSKDDFVSDINAITTCDNTNGYAWTIPNDITPDFSVKVRVSSFDTPSISSTSAAFKIRADINVLAPDGGERWVTNRTETISWAITGTVPTVGIYYSTDNFVSDNQLVITTSNTGSYNWTIPDRGGLKANSKVRICDSRDLAAYGQSPNPFSIDYYYITFNVLDTVTNEHMKTMTYQDPTRGLTIYPVSSPKTIGYPYNTNHNSIFTKMGYLDTGVDNWDANADRTFTIKMEGSVVHNWQIPVTFNYEPSDNSLTATGWFTRDGLVMPVLDPEGNPLLTNLRIDIYDQYDNLVRTLESNIPSVDGVFTITWTNTTLVANKTYWAKSEVTYATTPYRSASTFEIELDAGGTTHTWEVKGNINYNIVSNRLETTSWLTYDGMIIAAPDSVTITITDFADSDLRTMTSSTPDTWGVFRTTWDNPNLDDYQTYTAYIEITYSTTTYRGIIAFDLNQEGALAGSSGGAHDSRGVCGYLGIEPFLFILLLMGLRRASLRLLQ